MNSSPNLSQASQIKELCLSSRIEQNRNQQCAINFVPPYIKKQQMDIKLPIPLVFENPQKKGEEAKYFYQENQYELKTQEELLTEEVINGYTKLTQQINEMQNLLHCEIVFDDGEELKRQIKKNEKLIYKLRSQMGRNKLSISRKRLIRHYSPFLMSKTNNLNQRLNDLKKLVGKEKKLHIANIETILHLEKILKDQQGSGKKDLGRRRSQANLLKQKQLLSTRKQVIQESIQIGKESTVRRVNQLQIQNENLRKEIQAVNNQINDTHTPSKLIKKEKQRSLDLRKKSPLSAMKNTLQSVNNLSKTKWKVNNAEVWQYFDGGKKPKKTRQKVKDEYFKQNPQKKKSRRKKYFKSTEYL